MTTRRWFTFLGALLVSLGAACSGSSDGTTEATPVARSTEERVAAPFNRVLVDGAIEVTVRQKSGAPERIEVTAADGGHERVVTAVSDEAIEVVIDGDLLPGTSVLLVVAELRTVEATNGAVVSLVGELALPMFEVRASAGASIIGSDNSSLARGGVWRLTAAGRSTIDLDEVIASAVTVDVSGGSQVAIEVLTSALGTVEAGSTIEVTGDPERLELSGGGSVRAIGPRVRVDVTPEPSATARPDGLAGAPVPPPDTPVVDFDEKRFLVDGGTFPALTDPAIVPASAATWLQNDTLVLGATQNGAARAYPIFMMTFHHVANDVLGGEPYLTTF